MCDNLTSIPRMWDSTEPLFFLSSTRTFFRGIRTFKNKTGISIDYQNADDLYGIMRVVFINNSGDHHVNVNEQVRAMNGRVISIAISQIQTGVSQYIAYAQDIDTISTPIDRPINTSTTGNKIESNDKIGLN